MPTNLSGQLFDTVGLEVEGTLMDREGEMPGTVMQKLHGILGPEYFSKIILDRDASTESMAETLRIGSKILKISCHTPAYKSLSIRGSGNTRVYGYEMKTVPLEMSEVPKILYPLIFTLYEYGDVISDRSSIHVHVGYGNNLRMLQNYLRIMLTLEPVLYRLGGMGGTFRGHLNNAAYCRPLLNSCAVPLARISSSRTWVQILNPLQALEACSIADFWAAMGVDANAPSQNKYNPSRYSGTNFFALYSHGTAEWRYFNKSFDVPLILTIIRLMRATVETSALVNIRDLGSFDVMNSNAEISDGDAEGILGMVLALCHDKGVNHIPTDNEMSHLLDVLRTSHFIPLPETPTTTHISNFSVSENLVKRGQLKMVGDVLPTNYVDIHNIDSKPLSIFS